MGTEWRRGRPYYYRKVRRGGRVVSQYVGRGPLAELLGTLDQLLRIEGGSRPRRGGPSASGWRPRTGTCGLLRPGGRRRPGGPRGGRLSSAPARALEETTHGQASRRPHREPKCRRPPRVGQELLSLCRTGGMSRASPRSGALRPGPGSWRSWATPPGETRSPVRRATGERAATREAMTRHLDRVLRGSWKAPTPPRWSGCWPSGRPSAGSPSTVRERLPAHPRPGPEAGRVPAAADRPGPQAVPVGAEGPGGGPQAGGAGHPGQRRGPAGQRRKPRMIAGHQVAAPPPWGWLSGATSRCCGPGLDRASPSRRGNPRGRR